LSKSEQPNRSVIPPGGRSVSISAMTKAEIDEVIARLRSGDKDAFGEAWQFYQRILKVKGRRMGLAPEDIEDLVSEVFGRALSSYEKLPCDSEVLRRWLLRVMQNLAIDRFRRYSRYRGVPLTQDLAEASQRTLDAIIANERRERLREAINSMPIRDKLVLELSLFEDLSDDEITQRTGISNPKLVRHRAIRRLRKEINP